MDTKLTLSLDKSVIEKAKKYAKEQQISLSKMIESYLAALVLEKKNENKIEHSSTLVDELTGVISLEKDYDYREDYRDYITKKYS